MNNYKTNLFLQISMDMCLCTEEFVVHFLDSSWPLRPFCDKEKTSLCGIVVFLPFHPPLLRAGEGGEKVGLWLATHSAGKVNCANRLGSKQVLIQTPAAASRALAMGTEEEPSTDLVVTVCFLGGP